MARKKVNGNDLSVFKGREARLNRVILGALSKKDSQTTYEIYKQIRKLRGFRRVRYTSIRRRVIAVERANLIKVVDMVKTRQGLQAPVYGLTGKAYLTLVFGFLTLEDAIDSLDDASAFAVLAEIVRCELGGC